MIMLDTHVAVALYEGRTGGLGLPTRRAIDRELVTISPAVLLELELLFEIRRLREGAKTIATSLAEDLDIRVARKDRIEAVEQGDEGRDPARARRCAPSGKDHIARRLLPLHEIGVCFDQPA